MKFKSPHRGTSATILLSTLTFVSASKVTLEQNLINWLRSRPGGYYSPKQEIRREDPDDPSSLLGVFATERIEEDELLCSVPWENIITAGVEREPDEKSVLDCNTTRNLIREMELGEDSEFAPYVNHLLAQRRRQLPSAWSKAGKDLLKEILGGDGHTEACALPPHHAFSWIDSGWYEDCDGNIDPLEEHAALMVIQRADDDILVPVYDMYNHRNGKWFNTVSVPRRGVRYDVLSSRVIEAGEQVYISYNLCHECGGRAETYGTPEIFRDYGFVERYPQRWLFHDQDFQFDLREITDGSNELEVVWPEDQEELDGDDITFLRQQLARLEKVAYLEGQRRESPYNDDPVPQFEWDSSWQYHGALVLAITHAIKAAVGEDGDVCLGGQEEDGACNVTDGYDDLKDEVDNLFYTSQVCDNAENLLLKDFDRDEMIETFFQSMEFSIRDDEKDVCMLLDNIIQICANYRPHYHEFAVHLPARYVDTVRRVIFIGGGDSMILHEVLKYPSLELVVGLELDQTVVRHCFKRFYTQPHFDDERVEWWFGDATKSLLVLPKEYTQSFDLVLVDLSETAMSLTVTDELDVFGALALLLKPDGILVKNELYMEKMSEVFDYTAQLYLEDVPLICSQAMVMGSNGVDFFHHPPKDHHVETLLLQPLETISDPYDLMADYRKNSARAEGKCENKDKDSTDEPDQQRGRSAGVLMIIEAENAALSLEVLRDVELAISGAIQKTGFTTLSTLSSDVIGEEVIIVVLGEGYIVARPNPEHRYCGFEIHLWGGFEKMNSVKSALLEAVGSHYGSWSSYRVVVGGMFGSDSWKEDQKMVGPQIVPIRNCEDTQKADDLTDEQVADIVLEESLNLVLEKDIVVAVLCGTKGEPCASLDMLSRREDVRQVVAVWTCPTMGGEGEYQQDKTMFDCEIETTNKLEEAVGGSDNLSAFIVDASASLAMAKISNSIWSDTRNRERLLKPHVVVMAAMQDATETWRRHFLDRFRINRRFTPLCRAEVVLSGASSSMEMGIVSAEDPLFFSHLSEMSDNVKARTDLHVEVRKIKGGIWPWKNQTEWNPTEFAVDDYDARPAKEQYSEQLPLGRQSIFQLEPEDDEANYLSASRVNYALGYAITSMEYTLIKLEMFSDVGDGAVIVALMSEGSAVAVWDGRAHVDVNVYAYDEDEDCANEFSDYLVEAMPEMKISQRDDQPRGIGRVVNFRADHDLIAV